MFRWGIFGTGAVSAKFVAGLASAREANVVMVASRTAASAQKFASAFGVTVAVEGYANAAARGGVDAIYIATPTAYHLEHAMLCINAGIPVLIEKPLAATGSQASDIVEAARARGVFCMEGMWTRFMPAATALRELILDNQIGGVCNISGSFGTSKYPDVSDSSFNPALGGGALLQLGVYPLSLAHWLLGTPVDIQATGSIGSTGVDEHVSISLRFSGGETASFYCSIRGFAANDFHVSGTHGLASFRGPIFRPYGLSVQREAPRRAQVSMAGYKSRLREHHYAQRIAQLTGQSGRGRLSKTFYPYAGNGYHYEAVEVARCVANSVTESKIMPVEDSIAVLRTIDSIRQQLVRL